MSRFDDARELLAYATAEFPTLQNLHQNCLREQAITPLFSIKVKNFMENLRSALDYCACALFERHGNSRAKISKVYFPYVRPPATATEFRTVVERSIPGLLTNRPKIVELLENYQYFGGSGNWLYQFIEITNENKHQRIVPQNEKQYKCVIGRATIPAGGTLTLNLTKIPLGGGPDQPFQAVAGTWKGLEFEGSGVMVMPLLEHALHSIGQIVQELCAASQA